jgi:hypothetical protein
MGRKLEGGMGMSGIQGRLKQLLDDFTETNGYWKLKEEALDMFLCRIHFARGYGPVARQITN